MKNESDRCIALAGVFQAAELARQTAWQGLTDSTALEASIHSLFQVDAESVPAVYGGLSGVKFGLKTLRNQLQEKQTRNVETTRYVITLLHLEKKLEKKPQMLAQVAEGIETAGRRLEHFSMMHPNILAGLADTYVQTISTLNPRIMVNGAPLHLQNPENINRIRTLLLAGIRSAMLWRQCGGRRLQVILGRKRLLHTVNQLLQQLSPGSEDCG